MAEGQCDECQRHVTAQEEETQQGSWFARTTPTGDRVIYVCEACLTDETRAYYNRLTEEVQAKRRERR